MFWGIGLSSSSGTFLFSGSPVSSPSTASSKSSAASSRSSAAPSRSSSPSSPELSEASEDASPGVHSSTSSSSSYEDETVIISTGAFMISVDLSEINNASNSNSASLSPSIICSGSESGISGHRSTYLKNLDILFILIFSNPYCILGITRLIYIFVCINILVCFCGPRYSI